MTEPEFATDVSPTLMGLALDADEIDAIVILTRDGVPWSRVTTGVDPGEVAARLRKVAAGLEGET